MPALLLLLYFHFHAAPDARVRQSLNEIASTEHSFIWPNETWNLRQDYLWSQVPVAGVHVSVGSERGFMGAAANQKATALLLIDSDPAIVTFNLINIALLKAARNQAEYWLLRFANRPAYWRRAGLSPAAWEFWREHVVENRRFLVFHANLGGYARNYLFEDDAFERLSAMAKAGRIEAIRVNLDQREEVDRFVRDLRARGTPVSALDISNIAGREFLPDSQNLGYVLRRISKVTAKGAWLVTSRRVRPRWHYVAYGFDQIAKAPERVTKYLNFVKRIPLPAEENDLNPSEFRRAARGLCERALARVFAK